MKDKITAAGNFLINSAKDWKVWVRISILVIIFFAGAILYSKTKVKKDDCTACNNERRELINALIGIKKDLGAALNTSYEYQDNGFLFASYDTIPKNNQAQQIKRVMTKIDSILWKLHIDSLNRLKTKN